MIRQAPHEHFEKEVRYFVMYFEDDIKSNLLLLNPQLMDGVIWCLERQEIPNFFAGQALLYRLHRDERASEDTTRWSLVAALVTLSEVPAS